MPPKKGPGRPKKVINEEQVRQLAAINCTREEMAAVLGCHPDTLDNNFSDIIKEGRSNGRMSLKRKQFEIAMKGNVGMLIWLGKQLLDQREPMQELKTITEKTKQLTPTEMVTALRERAEQIEKQLKN